MSSYYSAKAIQILLEAYGKQIKKSLGQNYLISKPVLETLGETVHRIAKTQAVEHVLEIGPGIGNLSEELTGAAKKITLVEIDPMSCMILRDRFSQKNNEFPSCNIDILQKDYLNLVKTKKHAFTEPTLVAGNLPYNLTGRIIMETLFLLNDPSVKIRSMLFMMQKEAADRIISKPGSKTYGITSVISSCFTEIKKILTINPGSFYPAPKVKSTVLLFHVKGNDRIIEEKTFETMKILVKAAFNHRRKTLKKALTTASQSEIFKHHLNTTSLTETFKSYPRWSQLRAENLSYLDYQNLSQAYLKTTFSV